MGEKQLNFSAPLLSVRRISSTLSSSEKRKTIANRRPNRQISLPSEIPYSGADEVTEPVAVPFRWEQIPGRAKEGSAPKPRLHDEELSSFPRVPPARVLDIIQIPSGVESDIRNNFRAQNETSFLDEKLGHLEGTQEGEDSDKDSGSDAYSDAVDALSPTSSLSLSCSVSGLSGSDGPDVKPCGTFSVDQQTRDFMMNRFLPAAKAMVLETPHYASKRQSVAPEQPRQILRAMVNEDSKATLNKDSKDIIPHYGQYQKEERQESEDEHDASGNMPGCGLISRFCLRNSLCLVSPVPGMTIRTQVPKSSARVEKLTKNAYMRDHDPIVTKNAWDAFRQNQLDYEVQSSNTHEIGTMINVESNHTYSSDSPTTDGSSSHRHSSSGSGISPYRNGAPPSPFHEGMGFLGVPKEVESFKADRLVFYSQACQNFSEFISHKENKQGPASVGPIVEKTLYIDSVNAAENQPPSDSDTKDLMDNAGFDLGTLVERRIDEASSADSSFQDIRCLNISKEGVILKLKAPGSVDSLPSSSEMPHFNSQEDPLDSFRLDQGLDPEFRSLEFVKDASDGNLSVNDEQILKAVYQVDSNVKFLQSPVPPPLPKSPSESWLWRTGSFQKPNLRSKFPPRKQVSNTSSTDTKWETIVKTSKLHYDHVRYSEELTTHVPQQPKT